MTTLVYRSIGFLVDVLLYLIFMRNFRPRWPESRKRSLCIAAVYVPYMIYRLAFGYNAQAATVLHNVVIVAVETLIYWIINRWIYGLSLKVSLVESLIFVIAVHAGRKVFFHLVTPLFPGEQMAARIEQQLLVGILKIGVICIVTPSPDSVEEKAVKDLELFLLVFALYACFLMDYLYGQDAAAGWRWNLELTIYFVAVLCGFMVKHSMADHCELLRVTRLEQLRNRQYEHLRERLSGEQEIRRMCHDLKHQLLALRQDPECTAEMLQKVEQELLQHAGVTYADDPILNALLQEKIEAAKAEGVEIRVEMRVPKCTGLSDVELCILFGNALDNAVEGIRRAKGRVEPVVRIGCMSEPGFWAVCFRNPYWGKLETRNGLPRSTKANVAKHGIGLRSIRSCAEKHGGSIAIAMEQNTFALSVFIPVLEQPETVKN